jgi:uncharacterized protein (TIGR03435 family)
MKQLLLIVSLLAWNSQAFSQSNLIGTKSKDLDFTVVLNSETKQFKLSDFKSKVVILDFWATWCSPCIASFPYLESLQKDLNSEIQIITITDESRERIEKFLQKRKVNLPFALDADRKLSEYFPHRSVPHTIVIDKDGIIKAITTPEELTKTVLKDIIDGKEVLLSEKKDVLNFDPAKPLSKSENFTYQITVTPFQDGLPSMSNPTGGEGIYKNRRILCTNLSPKALYEIAFQFPISIRTKVEVKDKEAFDWSKHTAICFDLIVPEELADRRFEIMQQQLQLLYSFKPVIEKRKMNVKVLQVIGGQKAEIEVAVGGLKVVDSSGRGLSMKNAESKTIAEFLESQLNVPVLDETGLKGLYNLELVWYNEDASKVNETLREIGLMLTSAEKEADVLVIYDN